MREIHLPRRIKSKAIWMMLWISIISNAMAFVFSFAVSNYSVRNEMLESQKYISMFADELADRTTLTLEDISTIISNTSLQVQVIDDISAYSLSPQFLEQLDIKEVLTLPHSFSTLPITIMKIGNRYLAISARPSYNLFQMSYLRVYVTLLLSVLFLTVAIISVTGSMLRPFTKLSDAMHQVSTGDFTVRLPIPRQRKDEGTRLMENFNTMTAELQSIEYLQKDFISNVSHEFKTPIASILGFAKLLESPDLPEEDRVEYTAIIVKESQRLSRLSANLLRLSKLENQSRFTNAAPFLLDEQIRTTVLLLAPDWQKKDIQWDLDLDEAKICADEELLQQVWINLLNNAIKFSSTGGEISIQLRARSTIIVTIADHGIGMDKPTSKRIFDRFYQGDSSRQGEGNGLGLALVKRIVDVAMGVITVDSRPGQGSIFTVELPFTLPQKGDSQ